MGTIKHLHSVPVAVPVAVPVVGSVGCAVDEPRAKARATDWEVERKARSNSDKQRKEREST
jgi:hypothetical protein